MLSQIFSTEVEKYGNGKEKINRMAKKKTKKMRWKIPPSHLKNFFKNFIFYRLYLNLLKHLA